MKAVKNLIIMGAPGGGKGTISKKLLKDLDLQHISTGDLLRKNVSNNTDLGRIAQSFMNSGKLVPDNLVIDMVLMEKDPSKSSLLDGFPRTIPQAKSLQEAIKIDAVISLVIPRQTIIDRISNRWIHMPSGRTYAYDYNPPKSHGLDDLTGEPLSQREDDKAHVVASRLDSYESLTMPLIDHFISTGVNTKHFHGTESNVIYPKVKEFLIDELRFHH